MKHALFVSVLLTSAVAVAQPQPYGPPPYSPYPVAMDPPDPLRAPGFVTLDRGDGNSRAGAELSYLVLDGDANGSAMRFDLHGQYIDPSSGFGGYAHMPMSFVSGDSDSNFELAGVELGGLLAKRLSPELGIVVRGGVVLPTAQDDFAALIQNAIAAYARPSDVASSSPNTIIRLSGSPIVRSGQLFGRIDVGLDFLADRDDGDNSALLRLAPGIGFDGGTFAVTGEIVALRAVGGDDLDDEFTTVGAIGARFVAGNLSPYMALVVPFDDALRDVVNAAITLGVEAKL